MHVVEVLASELRFNNLKAVVHAFCVAEDLALALPGRIADVGHVGEHATEPDLVEPGLRVVITDIIVVPHPLSLTVHFVALGPELNVLEADKHDDVDEETAEERDPRGPLLVLPAKERGERERELHVEEHAAVLAPGRTLEADVVQIPQHLLVLQLALHTVDTRHEVA